MNLKKSHIVFILPVLFTWLSISEVNGIPRFKKSQQQGFSWKDTRLNVEFNWGAIPYGKLAKFFDEDFKIDTHFNYSAIILAGYSFPAFEDSRIGFESGLGYGFARVIENKKYNATLEENHFMIPLLLTIFKPLQTSFYCAHTYIVGYEFDIILSSMYKQSGYYFDLHPSLQGDADVAEFLPDFSRLSGNIVLSDRYDFPKGIYVALTCRLPIEIFSVIKEAKKMNRGLTMTFVKEMRWLNTNWIELTMGVNVVDWIYAQEGHLGKSTGRSR